MSVNSYDELLDHVGHEIECVSYGDDANIAIECVSCGEILMDYDHPNVSSVTTEKSTER